MNRPIAWGIVGTGGIARQFAADLALLPDAALIGICSRDLRRAKAFQTEFRAERPYSELDAMLADPGIDVMYIATPNALHAEQALRAIAAGKAVLVEKPIATSVADAERIGREAASGNSLVMEAMWTRFLPAVRAARMLVADGAIGEIRRVKSELSYRRNEDAQSRFYRPDLGGGAALDLGVYPVSLALHFLGRPSKVSGRTVASKSGVDKRSEFSLGFAGGAEAELACGFDREGGNQFVIEGSKGVLVLDAPFLKAQRLARFSPKAYAMMPKVGGAGIFAKAVRRLPLPGKHIQHFPFPGNGLQFEAAAAMEAVRRGETHTRIMPLGESVEVLRVIEAVVAGAVEGPSSPG
jgi:predicted dehydrogenase